MLHSVQNDLMPENQKNVFLSRRVLTFRFLPNFKFFSDKWFYRVVYVFKLCLGFKEPRPTNCSALVCICWWAHKILAIISRWCRYQNWYRLPPGFSLKPQTVLSSEAAISQRRRKWEQPPVIFWLHNNQEAVRLLSVGVFVFRFITATSALLSLPV